MPRTLEERVETLEAHALLTCTGHLSTLASRDQIAYLDGRTDRLAATVDELRGEVRAGFASVDERIDRLDQRMGSIESLLAKIASKLGIE